MNKVLVRVFFPQIDKWYEIWIPINKKVSSVIQLLSEGVNDLNDGNFPFSDSLILYNRQTGDYYDPDSLVKYTDIKNGTELILI